MGIQRTFDQMYTCELKLPDGKVCGQWCRLADKHEHGKWHKREERRQRQREAAARLNQSCGTCGGQRNVRAGGGFWDTCPDCVGKMQPGKVAYEVEQALLYLDRGLVSALDRVAHDYSKALGCKITAKDVLEVLKRGCGK